ncbi:MAG TPA: nitroreductase [Caulobacteraceae bacterium]|jgi:nitroreductase|nr:nitroreductase [Caulobacteraceae bacterium]
MNVSEAVAARYSCRAFTAEPVDAQTVRTILEKAHRAPSGGNLQPWHVFALAGEPLSQLEAKARESGPQEPEYDVYPPELWEPFRTRRFVCGEDLYASIDIPREDRPARFRQLARNAEFFGAPVGLFFFLERQLGPPQWSDLGMFMQTVMLLATEAGLATCAQEFWARYPRTVGGFLETPDELQLFSGMALGHADEAAPINRWRTRRDPFDAFAQMSGF